MTKREDSHLIPTALAMPFGTYRNEDERFEWMRHATAALKYTLRKLAPKTAQALAARSLEEAARFRAKREESHARCDTDGFLCQYLDGIEGNVRQLQAKIDLQGGFAIFPALFTVDGKPTGAKLREGQWGQYWFLPNETGKARCVGAFPVRSSTLKRKGYREGLEVCAAEAYVASEGFGLSGRCWASTRRTGESE